MTKKNITQETHITWNIKTKAIILKDETGARRRSVPQSGVLLSNTTLRTSKAGIGA